jgi:hypothetical protein
VESAAYANLASDRYGECHAEIAREAELTFVRLRPPYDLDWNKVLQQERGS